MMSSTRSCALALVVVTGCSRGETKEAHGDVAVDSSVIVTSVDLLRGGTVDQFLGSRVGEFGAEDTILAVVHTRGRVRDAALTMRWTGTDGQLVNETTQLVSLGMIDSQEFRLAPVGGWPRGTLRAQVLVNGNLLGGAAFRVR
jgi:hypothetical protein